MRLRKFSLNTIIACLSIVLISIFSAWSTQDANTTDTFSHNLESKTVAERYLPASIIKKFEGNYPSAANVILENTVDLLPIDNNLDSVGKPTILAVNWNGSVVTGISVIGTLGLKRTKNNNYVKAFIWSKDHGLQYITPLNIKDDIYAKNMNWDGTVVVGDVINEKRNQQAFIWTSVQGITLLDNLNNGNYGTARAVSDDGSVIVGEAENGPYKLKNRKFRMGPSYACMWSQDGRIQPLGTLNGGEGWSSASDVSGDGKVIIGQAEDGATRGNYRAYIWTRDKGMQSLGTLNGGRNSLARAVNWDGTVVVGDSQDGAGNDSDSRAFIWSQKSGMRSLNNVKHNHISEATAVSHDGKRVLGRILMYRNIKGKQVYTKEIVIWQVMPDDTIKTYSFKKTLMDKAASMYNQNYNYDSCMNLLGNIIAGKHVYKYGVHKDEQVSWLAHIPRADYLKEQNKAMDDHLIEFKW